MMNREEAKKMVAEGKIKQLYIVYINVEDDEYEYNFDSENSALTFARSVYNKIADICTVIYVWEYDFENHRMDVVEDLMIA